MLSSLKYATFEKQSTLNTDDDFDYGNSSDTTQKHIISRRSPTSYSVHGATWETHLQSSRFPGIHLENFI
ncbi:hypothetical protein HGRIS_012329 [Hohenbuehelia grisea]|uniref:Uncharacterized protein n=1 Tax=Hohenbuehelia grisea TaxID=104357 RepID=A0ABR3IRX3_9AGAR